MSRVVAPWQVWCTSFGPQIGREEASLRPAIVVGTTLACQLPHQLAIVVACTGTDRKLPLHPQVTSLDRPTFAMCDQAKSISRRRLMRRLAQICNPRTSIPSSSCFDS